MWHRWAATQRSQTPQCRSWYSPMTQSMRFGEVPDTGLPRSGVPQPPIELLKSSHAFVSYRPREACGYHGKHACVTGSGVFQTPETDTHYRALGNSDLSLALATRHSRSACIARSRVAVGRDRNYVATASPKVSCRVRCSKNSEQPPFRLALCRGRKCAHVWAAHEKLKLSCLFHYFQRKAWVWTRPTLDSTLQTRPLRN